VKLKITVNDKTYEVDVEAVEPESPAAPPRGYVVEPAPVRVAATPPAAAPQEIGSVDESKVCRSPVAGIVVRVYAQPGQSLQVGDVLLVLEAMKMETNITAPAAGKVKAIKAAPGESVQKGQIVVEFE
jgi:methylmalonyl-CoA carboxyltransferase 1.3S subunit